MGSTFFRLEVGEINVDAFLSYLALNFSPFSCVLLLFAVSCGFYLAHVQGKAFDDDYKLDMLRIKSVVVVLCVAMLCLLGLIINYESKTKEVCESEATIVSVQELPAGRQHEDYLLEFTGGIKKGIYASEYKEKGYPGAGGKWCLATKRVLK